MLSSKQGVHPLNTAGCCDGSGQVHHGQGALSYCTLCVDPECVARREHEWAAECGEVPGMTGRALYELVFGPSRHWNRLNAATRKAWDDAGTQLRLIEREKAA